MDPRLAFDPDQLGESYVIVPVSLIWIPWINCWNCAYVTNFDNNKDYQDARITAEGRVSSSFRTRLDTICQCDLS